MLSAHLDVSPEEQLLELARYLEEIKPEAAGVAAQAEQQIAAAETPEALLAAITGTVTTLVNNCDAFLAKNKESEAASPFYALEKLCQAVDPEDARGLLVKMAQTAASGDDKPAARAKIMSSVFNTLDLADPKRYDVYLMLVDLCGKAQLMGALAPQIEQQLDDWLREWDANADQARTLYKAIADGAKQCGQTALNKKYTRVFLKSLNGTDSALLATHKAVAQACIVDAIADKATYQFDDLLELDAIKQLEGEPAYNLLSVFISGNVKAFNEFRAKSDSFFGENDLDVEMCLKKIRLLTLVSLATDTAEVAYADVQEGLEISDKEVEVWIIDAIRSGLVDARMDQLQQKMIIRKAIQRTFSPEHWQRLSDRLDEWTSSVSEILEAMNKVREQTMYKQRA